MNCNWNGSNVEVITYRIQSIDPHYKATKESNVNVYDSITQVTMLHQPNLFYIQMFSEVNKPQDIQLWMDLIYLEFIWNLEILQISSWHF